MAEKQRIDKLVASTGKYTRSEVKKLIRAGLILVDGVAVRSGDDKVDPETVTIQAEGDTITALLLEGPTEIVKVMEI